MNRIVVGLGASSAARAALAWAAVRAAAVGAELTVVTALGDAGAAEAMLPLGSPLFAGDRLRSRAADWQRDVVGEVLAEARVEPTVTMVIAPGPPARVLRQQSLLADLLVLGSTQRRFRPLVRRYLSRGH